MSLARFLSIVFLASAAFCQTGPHNQATAYGATGNGIADDSAALQHAIDAQPDGAVLDFGDRSRTYLISRQLLLKPNVTYSGAATVRMNPAVVRGTQMLVLRYGRSDNVTLDGLTLDANGVGGGLAVDVMANGAQPAMNLTVNGVTFLRTVRYLRGPQDAAIYNPVGLRNSRLTNNVFNDCGSGISITNADHVVIAGNRFETIYAGDAIFLTFSPNGGAVGHGLEILRNSGRHLGRMAIEVWARQPTEVAGVVVSHNDFEDWLPSAGGGGFGVSMMTGRRAFVTDNIILAHAPGLGFGLEMGMDDSIVERNRVEGFSYGVGLHRGVGTVVRENQLERQELAGIQITNAPGEKSGLIIENNTIADAKRFGIWANSEGWSGSQLMGNRISRSAGAFNDDAHGAFIGIAVSPPGAPVTVSGNTIVQTGQDSPPGFSFTGLKINGGSGANTGSIYRDNVVQSASSKPFGTGVVLNSPGSADGLTLDDNRFEGLASVMEGAASRAMLMRGNTALRCASPGVAAGRPGMSLRER